ncbi:TetR/AcrR family transcriptional regulator [Streptomyces radicis]|nr:TetR family transcriptional regulator [Streptomyces radicis]
MTPPPVAKISLRERKKLRTRQAIRRAAVRLFTEQGYDATPIDQIAEAAEVSPSTVFRYFPTKEDIVLMDEDDALMEVFFRARPAHEPPLTALREAIRATLAQIYDTEEAVEDIRRRMRLVATVPALRARLDEGLSASGASMTDALAERTGTAPDQLELRVFLGAVLGGLREALLYWVARDLSDDLGAIVDRTFDVLEHDLADSAPRVEEAAG